MPQVYSVKILFCDNIHYVFFAYWYFLGLGARLCSSIFSQAQNFFIFSIFSSGNYKKITKKKCQIVDKKKPGNQVLISEKRIIQNSSILIKIIKYQMDILCE